MKMRNTSLHKGRQTANRMLPTWLGRGWLPPGKSLLKLLPFSRGSTGLTELPAAPRDSSSSAQPCQHWSTFPCPCQPTGAGAIYATPDLGTWRLSSWAKGHRQKLAEHRGYFGQGSSHLPGQVAEEPAREQRSKEQSPAWLCSPLELIPELTCPPPSTWMSCPRATFSLADRGWMKLSFLQQEIEGQRQLCPHQRVHLGNCAAPSP